MVCGYAILHLNQNICGLQNHRSTSGRIFWGGGGKFARIFISLPEYALDDWLALPQMSSVCQREGSCKAGTAADEQRLPA